MKKNKLLVILSLALTLSCLLSALSMNAFCINQLEHVYYVTNEEFTAVSNTYGYSSAVFTGNYYGPGDSRNDAIVVLEARGSLSSDFLTEIYVDFAGELLEPFCSAPGDQTVNVTFSPANVTEGDYITSLQCCTSNDNYADCWDRYYYAEWWGFPYGWGNYSQTPN